MGAYKDNHQRLQKCLCFQKTVLAITLFLCAFLVARPAISQTEDGSAIFSQKCTGCHTIGKGKLVGPDLAASREWSSTDLTTAVKRMQQMTGPLQDQEITALVKYLKSSAGSAPPAVPSTGGTPAVAPPDKSAPSTSTSAPAGAPAVIDVTTAPGSAAVGRRLFNGEQPLVNGGLSCIACHQAEGNGGSIGADLSQIANKMPAPALVAACEATPFKLMKDVYAKHPVTKEEAINLTKYFESIKGNPKRERTVPVGWLGIGGSAAMMAVIAWGYRNRKKGAREKLQRR